MPSMRCTMLRLTLCLPRPSHMGRQLNVPPARPSGRLIPGKGIGAGRSSQRGAQRSVGQGMPTASSRPEAPLRGPLDRSPANGRLYPSRPPGEETCWVAPSVLDLSLKTTGKRVPKIA